MESRRLGRSGLVVSEICLGTMTRPRVPDDRTAFAIMDAAYDQGIDFFDTAELYPVPPAAKWLHRTEKSSAAGCSQAAGRDHPGDQGDRPAHGWFRAPVRQESRPRPPPHSHCDRGQPATPQTDYVDLYQTHWPDHDFGYEETTAPSELVQEGR